MLAEILLWLRTVEQLQYYMGTGLIKKHRFLK